MALFQDIRPRQSSLGVAAGENRLQVHLQQEVYRGGLSDMAPTQPGTLHDLFITHPTNVFVSWWRNLHLRSTGKECLNFDSLAFFYCIILTISMLLI